MEKKNIKFEVGDRVICCGGQFQNKKGLVSTVLKNDRYIVTLDKDSDLGKREITELYFNLKKIE